MEQTILLPLVMVLLLFAMATTASTTCLCTRYVDKPIYPCADPMVMPVGTLYGDTVDQSCLPVANGVNAGFGWQAVIYYNQIAYIQTDADTNTQQRHDSYNCPQPTQAVTSHPRCPAHIQPPTTTRKVLVPITAAPRPSTTRKILVPITAAPAHQSTTRKVLVPITAPATAKVLVPVTAKSTAKVLVPVTAKSTAKILVPVTAKYSGQVTPSPSTICDINKITTFLRRAPVINSNSRQCPGTKTRSFHEALIHHACAGAPTNGAQNWKQQAKVTSSCSSIKRGDPVGLFLGNRYIAFAGLFWECSPTGFKFAIQQCGRNLEIIEASSLAKDPKQIELFFAFHW